MIINDILREKGAKVVTIGADKSIHEAITRLNKHRIGALVVTDEEGEIAGIITERDILCECGERCSLIREPGKQGTEPCPCTVANAMTTELVIGVPSDDLNYAMGIMSRNRIRHLPILSDGKLVGIISIGDLVNAHLEEHVFENRTLREYLKESNR